MRPKEKRVVFADLILTTSPGRAFSWNRFARTLLFIQVVCEPSKICREACILQHLIMNTKHKQHVKPHRGTHTHTLQSKKWLGFHFLAWHLQERDYFVCRGQLVPLCLSFRVTFLCTIRGPPLTNILCYHPLRAHLQERTPLVGLCVCLRGRSPATTSTWPEFSPAEGHNSPKVAVQTIVYATAHCCQVKGKEKDWGKLLPAL